MYTLVIVIFLELIFFVFFHSLSLICDKLIYQYIGKILEGISWSGVLEAKQS